mmetsp:Transcript_3080/g.5579  ORF Transcript_3080/g.5579 Transcript_3080/m.5579 type:complete len:86 (-) Transcript_3080:29-286(-)
MMTRRRQQHWKLKCRVFEIEICGINLSFCCHGIVAVDATDAVVVHRAGRQCAAVHDEFFDELTTNGNVLAGSHKNFSLASNGVLR